MTTPKEFDDIRPYDDEELAAVYDRLIADPQFRTVVKTIFPTTPFEDVAARMKQCKTSMDFQLAFCYGFLKRLVKDASLGCDMDTTTLDTHSRYTFVSNHRDIVLDSAFLDMLLVDAGFDTTCEIAIGDNLLKTPWVRDLARVNKSFIVKRGLAPKDLLMASVLLSRYMHYAISEKHENLWIAQAEGRAKDSDDRTQKGIIKMLTLGGEGSAIDRLQHLHIVPLSISYERDPCDYLKAREMQLRRDNPLWHKGPTDDLVSMRTGIMGYKGHIHYHCAPCLDAYLESLREERLNNNALFEKVCAHIDHEIHFNYRMYPSSYVALDLLRESDAYRDHYSDSDREEFEAYVNQRVAMVEDLPNKDEAFLRNRLLTMYANPAINYLKAHAEG